MRSEIEAVVRELVRYLDIRGVRAERVYLFGSHLKGKADEWSDVDLLVVSEDFAHLDYWDLIAVLSESERQTLQATGKIIETHAKTPSEIATCHPASFLADILKDAIVVYERPFARV
ncbi:MAG: nucleotidyltransferase domain-containing protein [Planctomycetes bacterium]|nr:nucleotidyltransferase domain-containing protein [Planctomycetota bacterium]